MAIVSTNLQALLDVESLMSSTEEARRQVIATRQRGLLTWTAEERRLLDDMSVELGAIRTRLATRGATLLLRIQESPHLANEPVQDSDNPHHL